MHFLQAGGSVEQLVVVLVSSPEFLQGQGKGTSDGFLDALYQDALGRSVDPNGRSTWGQQLSSGVSPAAVAAAVLASTEYRQDEVQYAYGHFLRRPADASGLNLFTAALAQGARAEQMSAQIVGSSEYLGRTFVQG